MWQLRFLPLPWVWPLFIRIPIQHWVGGGTWTPFGVNLAVLTGGGPPDPQNITFLPSRHRNKSDRFINRRGNRVSGVCRA